MTHEIIMEKQELEEMPKKNLAFKTIDHIDSDNDDDDDEKEVEGGITLIIDNSKTFLERSKKIKNSQKGWK
ncbi:hypothetical protein NC653_033815 [Populus alba x Populus x berolinensis]|uniref:Uncharacterized protein n=1 Tax=Populus alba x Populus x berolinensis TaxID=444605 RepID=A0AAD6Q0T6_9ROSI|nr:hypothetical protein NC653_033815 [Populus alba x Populus x berolinensis]